MTRKFFVPALALTFAVAAIPVLHADVKTEEKNLVTFGGTLGRLVNVFGGKAAKEGVVSAVAVSGDRKMSANDTRGEIIDLKEEKVYDLDMRRKTYTVTTFDELRRKMQAMEEKARSDAAKESKEPPPPQNQGKQYDIDFDVKNTGQTRTINGFDTREVIATVTVREKGKTLEESGGVVMTVDNWMTRSQPALKEISDFDVRYYQKLQGPTPQIDAQQLATAMAMLPGLKEAFTRYNKAGLDGTAIQSTTTVEGVKSADQMRQAQSAPQGAGDQGVPTSVGSALGGLMRRRAQANAEKNAGNARSTFMTLTNEVLKISPSASAADVAIPAGFKLQ
ncbi:MAG TPA: hypothetical protein VGZ27_16915 [Vicinamibacterales bacterium]|jgi:hypothetical protein|nr:hypothetical protein [Vicinamibacterales bacterium]